MSYNAYAKSIIGYGILTEMFQKPTYSQTNKQFFRKNFWDTDRKETIKYKIYSVHEL